MTKYEKFKKARVLFIKGIKFVVKFGNNIINLDGTIQSYYSDTKKSWDDVTDSYKELTNKNDDPDKDIPK